MTPWASSGLAESVGEGTGGLPNRLRESVQVLQSPANVRAVWATLGLGVKSGVGWGWGFLGSSQPIQTVHRLLQAVPLAQVVVNLTVLHSWIRGLAPCGNLPHGHPKGPLQWGRGERIRGCPLHRHTAHTQVMGTATFKCTCILSCLCGCIAAIHRTTLAQVYTQR